MKKSLLAALLLLLTTSANADVSPVSELECLAKSIYFEAGSESHKGKVAVAQVVLNRVNDGRYPDTICGVISQSVKIANKTVCQFSWYCNSNKAIIYTKNYDESVKVAKLVLIYGYRITKLNNALYFHASEVDPKWRKVRVANIGNHIFYSDHS